ncbi:MAG TPA: hypothetical protein VK604_18120 [Bryobacteraceae bacterium]|nr:hypothetical protein [Bryobacteraceae bacterium]
MAETRTATLRIRDWDAATKFAGIVALVAGGMWSVWIYHQTAKQHASAAQIEAQKPFSAKRLETYEKLVMLTSVVAQGDLPQPLRRAKRQDLDQVVNGPLALVAQDKVFSALFDFYRCLDSQQCTKGTLMLYSRNVARACRSSIEESWQVSLPPVPTSDKLP